MDLQEEKRLVRQAQSDPEVFGQLYEQYYSHIFGYILKSTLNLQTAQDLTSETFYKALDKLWQFRWKNIPFSAWLYKIAANEIRQYYRKQKPTDEFDAQKHDFESGVFGPQQEMVEAENLLIEQQEFLELHQQLALMPLPYQEVIRLRFFEQKSLKEISEILGKKESTIKTLLYRGLDQLTQLCNKG